MQFDLYVPDTGWVHRLDPRTKLAATLAALVACLLYEEPLVLGAVVISVHLLLLAARIPWKRLGWVWRRMLPLTIMILILQPFFSSGAGGAIIWQVGPVRWTVGGVMAGVVFALRANGMAFVAASLLFTTEPALLVRGLVKLGLPFEWGLTLSLALRYLPTTYGLYRSVYEAQQARGWDPREGGFFRRMRAYVPMLVAVMIAALRMADNLGMALAARGFGAPFRRTILHDIRYRPVDYILTGLMLVTLASLVVLRLV